jgi:hypothetical protein
MSSEQKRAPEELNDEQKRECGGEYERIMDCRDDEKRKELIDAFRFKYGQTYGVGVAIRGVSLARRKAHSSVFKQLILANEDNESTIEPILFIFARYSLDGNNEIKENNWNINDYLCEKTKHSLCEYNKHNRGYLR